MAKVCLTKFSWTPNIMDPNYTGVYTMTSSNVINLLFLYHWEHVQSSLEIISVSLCDTPIGIYKARFAISKVRYLIYFL